jgi:hypothetical protein
MNDDFPAAHSMDSQWFAIDKNGRVAVFDTGEPGPIPKNANSGQGLLYDVVDLLAAGTGGITYDMSDVLLPDGKVLNAENALNSDVTGAVETDVNALKAPVFNCIVWFATEEALRAMALKEVKRLPVPNAVVVTITMLEKSQWDELLRQLQSGGVKRTWIDADVSLARFGFFEYDYDDYNAQDPYKQCSRPAKPIRYDQLPQEARNLIGKFVLNDKDFSTDKDVNPDDYGECHRWG